MIFKSIRWTLLFWYAVIIVSALAALGWALHQEMERNLYRDTDTQLEFWMSTIQKKLDQVPSKDLANQIVEALPNGVIVSVSNASGRPLVESPDFSSNGIASEWSKAKPSIAQEGTRKVTWRHMRGSARRTSSDRWVIVAINARDQHHRIREFLTVLLGAGAGILVLAIVGGWFLITRALSPIDQIAITAERISVENLGERIKTEGIHSELGDLAKTLNDSFDRLEQSFDQQARFTADASHELRTPLTIILSHLELAEQEGRTKSDLLERIGICHEGARRMRSVVEGLLTLARADAGALRLTYGEVQLSELLHEVRDSMAPLADARGISFEHDLASITISGDQERLREVVINLYSNAICYNQEGGRVLVALTQDHQDAILTVEDTGRGIASDDLPRIFERFYRADKARAFSERGTGLGLAITQGIIELHGGSISVTSELEHGSKFTVRLPISD